MREGFESEAMACLDAELKAALTFEDLREFFGPFTECRPPLSDVSGRYIGLIATEENNLSSARLYELEFADGIIQNITEV